MKTFVSRYCRLLVILIMTCPVLRAQVPILNSFPEARPTILLDFTGRLIDGTAWNWNGPIQASPAGLSDAAILTIFQEISADFHPFALNITTDSTIYNKAPFRQRMRIIFTRTSQWYGNEAGASMVGSFSWGDETPAWVFPGFVGDDPDYIAAIAVHQIGHTLGLEHQSVYNPGGGKLADCDGGWAGNNGWSPIMGVDLYSKCRVWQKGLNCISEWTKQDDLAGITGGPNGISLRQDDYGDDYAHAFPLMMESDQFSIRGVINHPGDLDVLKLELPEAGNITLRLVNTSAADPAIVDTPICITLLDSAGHCIKRKCLEPGILYTCGIILEKGTYYLQLGQTNHVSLPSYYAVSGKFIRKEEMLPTAHHLPIKPLIDRISHSYSGSLNTHNLQS